MKINLSKVLILVCCFVSFFLTIFLFVSCDSSTKKPIEPVEPVEPSPTPSPQPSDGSYKVGDIGPAGGIIFYDCDADNNVQYVDNFTGGGETKTNKDGLISSECGWRYLEAAPEDLSYKNSYGVLNYEYVFGYCLKTGYSSTYRRVGTKWDIGAGKDNTTALVKSDVEDNMYLAYGGEQKGIYAALACSRYSNNGFDDWFLPSSHEIGLMYTNLYMKGLGSFDDSSKYWSSTESSGEVDSIAWDLKNGYHIMDSRGNKNRVRPVRRF